MLKTYDFHGTLRLVYHLRLSPDITWPKAYNNGVDFNPSNVFLSSVCLINKATHKFKSKGHDALKYSSRMLGKLEIYLGKLKMYSTLQYK